MSEQTLPDNGSASQGEQSKDAQAQKSQPSAAPAKKEPRHTRFRQYHLVNAGKKDEPKWRLNSFCRFLAAIILIPLFRVRVTGTENISQEPCLLCPNHVSYLDGLVLLALSRRYKMPLRFLGKRELWNSKFLAWVLDSAGVFPISPDAADLDTLRLASRSLKAGDSVAIFPEGTRVRNEDMQTDKDRALGAAFGGAAWLAIRNNVPAIPVAIAGTELVRPEGMKLARLPRVVVRFGEPLVPDEVVPSDEYKRKERIAKLTELIMDGLAQSLETARTER
ncbi:MAG: 1-acyl-sn-glycerol-3-phosphate acyltransferase [Coriobacteriia bacterium]|nr:1-acyl-sn-glycerol-3-phosphate acyltransferase [Coriobacteriia bacterium]